MVDEDFEDIYLEEVLEALSPQLSSTIKIQKKIEIINM